MGQIVKTHRSETGVQRIPRILQQVVPSFSEAMNPKTLYGGSSRTATNKVRAASTYPVQLIAPARPLLKFAVLLLVVPGFGTDLAQLPAALPLATPGKLQKSFEPTLGPHLTIENLNTVVKTCILSQCRHSGIQWMCWRNAISMLNLRYNSFAMLIAWSQHGALFAEKRSRLRCHCGPSGSQW